MKKIIIPIDFSDNTEYLIQKALEYLHKDEFEIYLIHISSQDIGFIIGEIGVQYLPELEENTIKKETDILKNISENLNNKSIKNTAVLLQGNPSDEILDYSYKNNMDLIIMGTHGRTSLYEAFIGSVSKNVIKKSKIPVLLIPMNKI